MQFIGSSADQENVVANAVAAATNYIANADEYVTNPPSDSTGERYTTWFGQDDPERRAHVEGVLNNLVNNDLTTFIYDCVTNTLPDVPAYVYPDQFGTIYLGTDFWKAPLTGTDSQAGILVRETSKFLANGGTKDHEYSQDDCLELARLKPDDAITNANNYGYFVENDPPLA
ncbi:M35 family metallo-endopeptidase [Streptomyces anulatus]|uniref:M35 family metallo-endopeptidase n=1 Tax=Streptomyces anulatus TaxID=1892 RepID=UPI002E81DCA3|nr:M35 family metallo-endopeptidase [Streptomyces anulatus]MDF9801477.1 hypothetical protein [Streptomyces sp. HB372]WUC92063.1 M35 family metallo-endopeptidase [Streptomyces anulatus]